MEGPASGGPGERGDTGVDRRRRRRRVGRAFGADAAHGVRPKCGVTRICGACRWKAADRRASGWPHPGTTDRGIWGPTGGSRWSRTGRGFARSGSPSRRDGRTGADEFWHVLTGSPKWSPDGRTIAFDSRRDGHPQIYAMDVPGPGEVLLPALPVARRVAQMGNRTWCRLGRQTGNGSIFNRREPEPTGSARIRPAAGKCR